MASTTGRTGTPTSAGPAGPDLLAGDDGVVALALSDESLVQGLNDLRCHLDRLVAGGTHTVEIDVSQVDRLSSGCIATLLWVKRTCTARHIRVVLRHPTPRTLSQLRRTGLAGVLEIRSQAS